jgi:outer membrane protein OmpA-like peptidoglycan-associated protein
MPLGRALSDPRLAGNTFLIAGHSDGRGSADCNVDLSQKRAEAVRLYLIARSLASALKGWSPRAWVRST